MTWRVVAIAAMASLAGLATAAGQAADVSAASLAASMKAARRSEGYEIRLTVDSTDADGHSAKCMKLVMVGDADAGRERVLLRVMAPESARGAEMFVESIGGAVRARVRSSRRADGASVVPASAPAVSASAGAGAADVTDADASRPIVGSQLVPWDLLAPWWNWQDQTLGSERVIDEHRCIDVTSHAPASSTAAVREVVSCIDTSERLPLQTRLYDGHHRLLRSIDVIHGFRTDSGAWVARTASITTPDGRSTRFDIYAGDQHHAISADTYAVSAAPSAPRD